ncbi:MAG: phenylalanine--tRNA ligase subunit beta [Puniceicoccales bacterium]|jgi:phenylalanyl-tRNA synthetase beta chain|nr:phenylalanine--tRNA ligase subunit beta [Puniceicoccales bacterium]
MKINLKWLKKFIDLDVSKDDLAETFTKLGLEVESISGIEMKPQETLVVGEIIKIEKHPNADRLNFCEVKIGENDVRNIVCGAKNFKLSDKIPVALPGTFLPDGTKIKKSNLRGIASDGMMCSGKELGLTSDHSGLLILEKNIPVGKKFHELFDGDDITFELKLTANRGDALCHYGVARELSAYYNIELKPIDIQEPIASINENSLSLEISSDCCRYYSAWKISEVKIETSPDWLIRDLKSIGVNSINNVVDITNWIMFSFGQPLHAFDLAKMTGDKVIVRQARNGEKILTLDSLEHEIDPSATVIADINGALALAGIIGGSRSCIDSNTTDILLESAYFDATKIHRTARKLGIGTDSSYRYAREIDPSLTQKAGALAAKMIVEICGGKLQSPCLIADRSRRKANVINLELDFVKKVLGFAIDADEILAILKRLKYDVDAKNSNLKVSVPTFRWEITRPVDLVEEILRIYGTDRIPEMPFVTKISDRKSDRVSEFTKKAENFLANNNFNECYNYTLGCVDDLECATASVAGLKLANPLLEDQTYLRPSLLPGLLKTITYNIQNSNNVQRLFEIGNVFRCEDGILTEALSVAFVILTENLERSWLHCQRPDFYEAKRLISRVFELAEIATQPIFSQLDDRFWQKNYSAKAGDISKDSFCLKVGHISYNPCHWHRLDMPIIGAEFVADFSAIGRNPKKHRYEKFPTLPKALRDISLLVDASEPAGMVMNRLNAIAKATADNTFFIEKINLFDVYRGPEIPAGSKSLSFELNFQPMEKTLEAETINAAFEKIQLAIERSTTYSIRKENR